MTEANVSKIAEFGLSLDGQAARWYLQNDIVQFTDIDQLCEYFIQLFHRRVSQRELMSQFYAMTLEAMETVLQFVMRLRKQLTRSPTLEELLETFLTTLREPQHTNLAVVDLTGKPIEDVINRLLRLDNA